MFNTPVYVLDVANSACLGSALRAKHGNFFLHLFNLYNLIIFYNKIHDLVLLIINNIIIPLSHIMLCLSLCCLKKAV